MDGFRFGPAYIGGNNCYGQPQGCTINRPEPGGCLHMNHRFKRDYFDRRKTPCQHVNVLPHRELLVRCQDCDKILSAVRGCTCGHGCCGCGDCAVNGHRMACGVHVGIPA